MKMLTAVKSCLFLALATVSIGASAHRACDGGMGCDPVYVGNPDRPDTIWVPGHYAQNGCWKDGYYIKFYRPVCNGEVVWNGDHYDYARPYRVVRGEDVVLNNYRTCGHHMYYKYHHKYYRMNDYGYNGYYGHNRYNFVNSEYYNCHHCMMK